MVINVSSPITRITVLNVQRPATVLQLTFSGFVEACSMVGNGFYKILAFLLFVWGLV